MGSAPPVGWVPLEAPRARNKYAAVRNDRRRWERGAGFVQFFPLTLTGPGTGAGAAPFGDFARVGSWSAHELRLSWRLIELSEG